MNEATLWGRAALFVFTVAALGCSSGGSSAANGPDTCKMVDKADVQAALGGTVGPGMPGKDKYHCSFTIDGTLVTGEKADASLGAAVNVIWNSHVLTKDGVVAMSLETIPELPDAYYQKLGNTVHIAAKNGELTYQITVSLLAGDDRFRAALTALVKATYQRPG